MATVIATSLAQRGFRKSLPKYRVAVSTGAWDPTSPATSSLYYQEKRAGRASVNYYRVRRPEASGWKCGVEVRP